MAAVTPDQIETGLNAVIESVLESVELAMSPCTDQVRSETLQTVRDACANHWDEILATFYGDGSPFDEGKTDRWDFTVPDETAGTTYRPWTNGWAVGFAVTDGKGQERFIYLNPSGGSDDGVPNVFVYEGRSGDPLYDGASHHYDIDFS